VFATFDVDGNGTVDKGEILQLSLANKDAPVDHDAMQIMMDVFDLLDPTGVKGLDFNLFRQFNAIVVQRLRDRDEIAKLKEQEEGNSSGGSAANGNGDKKKKTLRKMKGLARSYFSLPYATCFSLKIKRRTFSWLVALLAFALFLYNVAYCGFTTVLVGMESNMRRLNPGNTDTNKYYRYVRAVRALNLINFIDALLVFAHGHRRDRFEKMLVRSSFSSRALERAKLAFRPWFCVHAISSGLFVLGSRDGWPWEARSLELLTSSAQVLVTFFSLSYYLYMQTLDTPATACNKLKVLCIDVLLMNTVRFLIVVLKFCLAVPLFPIVLLLTVLMMCCSVCSSCNACLGTDRSNSWLNTFLTFYDWLHDLRPTSGLGSKFTGKKK
jgi:hypothetical protein